VHERKKDYLKSERNVVIGTMQSGHFKTLTQMVEHALHEDYADLPQC